MCAIFRTLSIGQKSYGSNLCSPCRKILSDIPCQLALRRLPRFQKLHIQHFAGMHRLLTFFFIRHAATSTHTAHPSSIPPGTNDFNISPVITGASLQISAPGLKNRAPARDPALIFRLKSRRKGTEYSPAHRCRNR